MKKISIFIIILICSLSLWGQDEKRKPVPKLPPHPQPLVPYSETKMVRVDPHGARNSIPSFQQAQDQNECHVCHVIQGDRLLTKTKSVDTCLNCHNKSPHSGIEEHLKAKVDCISCHSFHRGDAISWAPSSGKFKGLRGKPLEDGLVERTNQFPMLRKNCTDCHKW